MTAFLRVAAFVMGGLAIAIGAGAQGRAAAPATIEAGAAFGMNGGVDFGTRDATLTANGPGRTSDTFVLFKTSTEMPRARSARAWVAVALGPLLSIEGAASLHQPAIVTTIRSDVERPDATFAIGERLSRYTLEGNVLLHLRGLGFAGGRGLPFVDAGAAYLRDVDQGRVSVQTGRVVHAGAGLKYYFVARPDGFMKAAGVRVEGRIEFLTRGLNPGDKTHRLGSGSAGVFVGF